MNLIQDQEERAVVLARLDSIFDFDEPKTTPILQEEAPKREESKKLFDTGYVNEFQAFCLRMAEKTAQEKTKELDPKDPDDAREITLLKIKEQKKAELVGQVVAAGVDFLPRELTGSAILTTKFPEPKYAVPEILPEGAILFAGPPKDGKSWLIHCLFVAITHGRKALGQYDCPPGDVLYFCLEDPHFLAQERVLEMLDKIPQEGSDTGSAENMKIIFRVDSIAQLMDDSASWLAQAKNPKLIVIDTLASIMPDDYDNDNFKESYKIIKGFREWAKHNHIAVIIVHHTSTKSKGYNPIAEVMGSTGLIAAPETIWVLYSKKEERFLHTVSKFYRKKATYSVDYEETGYWRIVKEVKEEGSDNKKPAKPAVQNQNLSNQRRKILDILKLGSMTAKEVSEQLQEIDSESRKRTRQMLNLMKKDGLIFQDNIRGPYKI